MKSTIEFEAYYQSHIKSDVEKLEEKRVVIANKYSFKKYRKRLLQLLVFLIVFFVTLNFFPQVDIENFIVLIPISFLYAIVAPIYIFIKRNLVFDPLITEYKTTVIPKLISFIDKELQYDAAQGISQAEFIRCGLFERPSMFKSEDLISGTVGKFNFRIADIQATRSANSGGKSSTETVFTGLYGYTKLNRNFTTPIYLKPTYTGFDAADKLIQSFLDITAIKNFKDHITGTQIKTGNAEFDNSFLLRSLDEAEALKIINTTFVQMLLAFKKQLEVPVHLALFENELHFGFYGVNLFEVNAHQSLTEKNVTLKYFTYLNLALGLAEAVENLRSEHQITNV